MASEIISRDQNSATVGAGVSPDSDLDISMLRVDPVTGYLLIEASSIGATSANTNSVARRDQNQHPVCMGYDETNDILVEILTDADGNLLCDITT
jgi:hypothetical protein